MRFPRIAHGLIAVVGFSAVGCYHATVDTGLKPSSTVIDKQWAHGFVYGLVPPSTVETASKCPHGVARIETQRSFLNLLAEALTFGIYTPMQITVTCAESGAMADGIPTVRGPDTDVVLARAILRSAQTGEAVNAEFTR